MGFKSKPERGARGQGFTVPETAHYETETGLWAAFGRAAGL